MADRYWVGGSANWNLTSSWSATSGGPSGASVPTSTDNAIFNSATTYTVSVTASTTVSCANFTVSAGTVTFTLGSSSSVDTYGNFNIIGSTIISNSNGSFNFAGTSGTQLITTNGVRFYTYVSFTGSASYQLQDDLLVNPTAASRGVFLTSGTLNLNNKQISSILFSSSNTNNRTLAFGSTGKIVLLGPVSATTYTAWDTSTSTNFTVTGTATVDLTNLNGFSATHTISTGTTSESNSVSFNFLLTSGNIALFPSGTQNNYKNINFANFTGSMSARVGGFGTVYGDWTFSTGMTVAASTNSGAITFGNTSGTQTITCNGKSFNAPLTMSGFNVFLADALIIETFTTARALTLAGGTFDVNSRTISSGGTINYSSTGTVTLKNQTTALACTVNGGTLTQGTANTFAAITHTSGTLDLAGFTLSATSYATGAGTKNLTFNGGTIAVSAATTTVWNNANPTGYTTTAGTGTGKISMTAATAKTFVGGGSTYNCTLSQDGAGQLTISGSNAFTTIANTVVATILFTAGTTTTVVNWGINGLLASNITVGSTSTTNFTISKSSGIVLAKYITLSRSTATGGASWYASIGSTNSGNNSGWIFGANKYWVGGTGNWSNAAKWSTSSGGAGGADIFYPDVANFDGLSGSGTCTLDVSPTIQGMYFTPVSFSLAFGTNNISLGGANGGTTDVFNTNSNFSATGTPVINVISTGSDAITITPASPTEANTISFNFTGGTYNLTMPASSRVRSLDFTGFSGSITSNTLSVYGDLTLSPTATLTSGTANLTFASTSATTRIITSNGVTIGRPIIFNGVNGSWRLADSLAVASTRSVTHTNGTLDLNGKTLTLGLRYLTATGTKVLTFNGGTVVCLGANTTSFNNVVPTGFSTVAGTGTGYIRMTAATAKTFVGGGSTYNCTLSNDGAGALTISGSNTFTTLSNGVQPATFTFTAGTTQTVTNWNVSGTAGNLVTITSSTAGTAATLSKASGTVSADYLSIQDSSATGGATWYAGANSTNVSGNSGWIFTAAPMGNTGAFFFMF